MNGRITIVFKLFIYYNGTALCTNCLLILLSVFCYVVLLFEVSKAKINNADCLIFLIFCWEKKLGTVPIHSLYEALPTNKFMINWAWMEGIQNCAEIDFNVNWQCFRSGNCNKNFVLSHAILWWNERKICFESKLRKCVDCFWIYPLFWWISVIFSLKKDRQRLKPSFICTFTVSFGDIIFSEKVVIKKIVQISCRGSLTLLLRWSFT